MAGRKKKASKKPVVSGFNALYKLIAQSFAGKIVFYTLIVAILVYVIIFLTGNNIDNFFKVTGVVVLGVTVISWLTYLFIKK